MASPRDKLFGFDKRSAQRIGKVVRQVERQPWSGDVGSRVPVALWNPGTVRAKVTTAIPTGTFASPSSSGAAQIYMIDDSGDWSEWNDPVQVYNDHVLSASVAIDTTVKLSWICGQWWLLAADCPS